MMGGRLLLVPVFVAALATGGRATAQSASAEALFQEGKALLKAGKFQQACPKLEESYRQDPATGALLALAMCHEKQGKTATAWAEYLDVARRSKQEGRKDRAEAAHQSADRLQPVLSQLKISVDPNAAAIEGLEIKLDGVNVGQGAWGAFTPSDPGTHVVQASAAGFEAWSATFELGSERDQKEVTVPPLQRSQLSSSERAAATAPPDAATQVSDTSAPSPAQENQKSPLRTAGWVVGGVGLVGLGLGSYFGISALNGKKDTDAACPAEGCTTPDAYSKRHDAYKAGNYSTVAFVAGGVLLATGVTLVVVGGPKKSERSVQAALVPAVGPRDAALLISGHF
jgi:serine/threonine-protein kinase